MQTGENLMVEKGLFTLFIITTQSCSGESCTKQTKGTMVFGKGNVVTNWQELKDLTLMARSA